MSLADVLKPTARKIGRGIEIYEGLSQADQETLIAAIFDRGYTHQDIIKGLAELGHEITLSQMKEFATKVRNGVYNP